MENDKMSQCCCDLFKIHKKTRNCVVTCYHKSFLLRHSNVSLENGKKLCVQCRKKIMKMPGEVQVEQSISSTSS